MLELGACYSEVVVWALGRLGVLQCCSANFSAGITISDARVGEPRSTRQGRSKKFYRACCGNTHMHTCTHTQKEEREKKMKRYFRAACLQQRHQMSVRLIIHACHLGPQSRTIIYSGHQRLPVREYLSFKLPDPVHPFHDLRTNLSTTSRGPQAGSLR